MSGESKLGEKKMKRIITLFCLVVGLITLSPANLYYIGDGIYSYGVVYEDTWYECYLGMNALNNNTAVIDGETIARTGTATYVYVNIDNGAATCTETGNPANGDAWASYTIYHTPGTTVSSSASHAITDNQYGSITYNTSVSHVLY
jgi:hypothetical protein